MKTELTRKDTAILKGMGILCIILHNFLHLLPFTVHENEYTFNLNKSHFLWQHLTEWRGEILADIVSYFGHYGVPVFLFASGYGLVRKYEDGHVESSFGEFVRYNLSKPFKLMIIAYIVFLLIDKWNQQIDSIRVVAQLTFTGNMFPHPLAYPGPYWYFSLTLQLYLLYYLVLRRVGRGPLLAIVIACCVLQAFYILDRESLNYIRYNFPGSVLPFSMGIWAARYGMNIRPWHFVASAAAIFALVFCYVPLLGNVSGRTLSVVSGLAWLAIPFFVVTGFLSFARILPSGAARVFGWVGGISAAVFATHPIVRSVVLPLTSIDNYKVNVAIYLVACLIIGYLYGKIVKQLR